MMMMMMLVMMMYSTQSQTREFVPLASETGGVLLLLLHQFSLRAHFQVSININKYIIESEARTVRRLTISDIEKVCLESLPENVI